MKTAHIFCVMALCMGFVLAAPVQAQEDVGDIILESFSPRDVADSVSVYADEVSNGLPNVAQGYKVYLRANVDSTVAAWAFSLASQPTASAAALVQTVDDTVMTLTPDSTGQYQVILSLDGVATDTVWINAGTYVGVGTIVDGDATPGRCNTGCHAAQVTAWQTTNHSDVVQRQFDGEGSDHFAGYCMSCHALGYGYGGFDTEATAEGWTFPDSLVPGTYASFVTDYPETAKLSAIQCESCHGPGSEHIGAHDKNQIAYGYSTGICAQCHDSGSHHFFPDQWANSAHSNSPIRTSGSCVPCHTSQGFVQAVDGTDEEVDNYLGVTCQTCHDPHSAENIHQLRTVAKVTLGNDVDVEFGGKGQLCMNCHKSRRDSRTYAASYVGKINSHYGPHHGIATDMIAGTNAYTFGETIASTGHKGVLANSCVDCHMVQPADSDNRGTIGEHTWHMEGTTEDGDHVQNIEVCQSCHGASVTSFSEIMAREDHDGDGTIEGVKGEVAGLSATLAALIAPDQEPDHILMDTTWTLTQLKALYNLNFIAEDMSGGLHNGSYAVGILKAAINAIQTGDALTITDVADDQGGQVHVKWLAFGGDVEDAADALVEYGVWRQASAMAKATTVEGSLWKAGTIAEVGAVYTGPEGVWEYIGRVVAANHDVYSVVAPTLVDSSATSAGTSTFYVTGHYDSGAIVHSQIGTGYSIDNIEPAAPKVTMADAGVAGKVTVSWIVDEDDPKNADIAYYAIYRGTDENFTPSDDNRFATVIETQFTDNLNPGDMFYYIIATVDNAGNESGFSVVATSAGTIITGIEDLASLPTSYSLNQNYPNPFNPVTTIRFGIPVTGETKLVVYDLRGVPVRTLVNEVTQAGFSSVQWDGRNNSGVPVASGIYIYRLQSRNFVTSKKMVMLK
jgi:hypothetical protein